MHIVKKTQRIKRGLVKNTNYLKFFIHINILIDEQAWINAYRVENKKYFEAILTNQKLNELESQEIEKEKKKVPKRQTNAKKHNFTSEESSKNPKLIDGFYLV